MGTEAIRMAENSERGRVHERLVPAYTLFMRMERMRAEADDVAEPAYQEPWECRPPFCSSDEASGQLKDCKSQSGCDASRRRRTHAPFVSRTLGHGSVATGDTLVFLFPSSVKTNVEG